MWAIAILFVVINLLVAAPCQAAGYGVARVPAPVLNVPEMKTVFGGRDGKSLKTDSCGQVRELEFIALPGTPFRILAEVRRGATIIYRVETEEYPVPAGTSLYVDSRFIESRHQPPPPRPASPPPREKIISTMAAAVGTPYVWGGNVRQGVPELLQSYYRGKVSDQERKHLALSGLDCSGLLYEATGGWTPRNTSELVSWGSGVPVAGKGAAQIAAQLEPLDLILWNGHVIIVLDRETAIESRLECDKPGRGGVVTTPLRQRLEEIMRTRRPVDVWPAGSKKRDIFVVRRWLS
ncbi:MAG: hypothetical protein A2X80_03000 [Geobacteraceae bacterium GWB2_52_12]|nr:MAG: hypothetical protein A2X80_03000 [Geobacteraceae bacterium GWB2_52_12]